MDLSKHQQLEEMHEVIESYYGRDAVHEVLTIIEEVMVEALYQDEGIGG